MTGAFDQENDAESLRLATKPGLSQPVIQEPKTLRVLQIFV